MMGADQDLVAREVARIIRSRKYRNLCADTVRDVVSRELGRRRKHSEAIAAARRTLHRIASFYLSDMDPTRAEQLLRTAYASPDAGARDQACLEILRSHRTTLERIPHTKDFYDEVFAVTGRPSSILDLACGLNPFALRWMSLPPEATYVAYDINNSFVELVSLYFSLESVAGRVEHRDILVQPPGERGDVALFLKTFHCVERRRKGAALEIVAAVPARWTVVSFPARNLRDQIVDICGNYREAIVALSEERSWRVHSVDFEQEPILMIEKPDLVD